jgi:hypothetical protein
MTTVMVFAHFAVATFLERGFRDAQDRLQVVVGFLIVCAILSLASASGVFIAMILPTIGGVLVAIVLHVLRRSRN